MSPVGTEERILDFPVAGLDHLPSLWDSILRSSLIPAMNRWAIVFRPPGLGLPIQDNDRGTRISNATTSGERSL